jgi:hypothetical protein
MQTFDIAGIRGRYQYTLADLSLGWNEVGGCYIFAKVENGRLVILRVGKCDSFRGRPMPPKHECWEEAVRDYGATHLLVRVVPNALAQAAEEQDLIAAYNPPMNQHYRTAPAGVPADPLAGLFGTGLINQRGRR